jgi:hypothetical protein
VGIFKAHSDVLAKRVNVCLASAHTGTHGEQPSFPGTYLSVACSKYPPLVSLTPPAEEPHFNATSGQCGTFEALWAGKILRYFQGVPRMLPRGPRCSSAPIQIYTFSLLRPAVHLPSYTQPLPRRRRRLHLDVVRSLRISQNSIVKDRAVPTSVMGARGGCSLTMSEGG